MIGETLSHYHIISKIGAGGLKTKLSGADEQKVTRIRIGWNGWFARQKSAAALNHPNIAHIYEISEGEGTPSSQWNLSKG